MSSPPDNLRVAHLTATFPPYPGGAGNTAHRFAVGQAERGHHVEVFTAPAPGTIPESPGVDVHRIEPVFAIGNAPLIPSSPGWTDSTSSTSTTPSSSARS